MINKPLYSPTFTKERLGFNGTIVFVCLFVWGIWKVNNQFFFQDDTQNGAYGIWYEIGNNVLSGQWYPFKTSAWMAGNYAAEGQWGLFSPMFMLIGVLCVKMNDAYLFCALLKGFFMCLGATGLYRVARSYSASPLWSLVVGVACSIAGFTLFRDVTSWVTNLMIWAILPWVWWSTRRLMYEGKSPLVPFVFGYCLVTTGYVQGTIMLILMYISLLVENCTTKNTHGWRLWKNSAVVKMVINGALLGLVAFTVYYPGTQATSVANRYSGITNDGFYTSSPVALFAANSTTLMPKMATFKSPFSLLPYEYIAWFLPLIAFIKLDWLRANWKTLSALFTFTLVSFLYTISPSNMGPLRFPIRIEPFVCFGVLTIFAVLMTRSELIINWKRCVVCFGYSIFGWYLAWTQMPGDWKFHAKENLIVLLSLALTLYSLSGKIPVKEKRQWLPLILIVKIATGFIFIYQVQFFNHNLTSGYSSYGAPRYFDDYKKVLPEAVNDVIVLGFPEDLRPDIFQMPGPDNEPQIYNQTAVSNNWYITGHNTHNLYSVVEYEPYSKELNTDARGQIPDSRITKANLFGIDPTTGKPIVDLLQIDTIQILHSVGEYKTQDEFLAGNQAPPGWHVAKVYDKSLVWIRDNPIGPSGGVTWTSPGTDVQVLSNTEDSITYKVNAAPEEGGRVVFSRLNWPGYELEGGDGTIDSQQDSVRQYLLGASVPASSVGQTITIRYIVPLWTAEKVTLGVSLVGISVWTIAYYGLRLSKRTKHAKHAADS